MERLGKLGTIACECVIFGRKPVLAVSHAGGDWQMYCSWDGHDYSAEDVHQKLKLVAIRHLVERDSTLREVLQVPVDVGAERASIEQSWIYFEDRDD